MLLAEVAAASADVGCDLVPAGQDRVGSPTCCARPAPDEVATSWCRGCPASCRSARSASAGRRCARCRQPRHAPSLTVAGVDAHVHRRSATTGRGLAGAARRSCSPSCSARRPRPEQTFLRRLLGGELRQGALLGVMADAVAKAADVPLADVRRAAMLSGDLPARRRSRSREGVAGAGRSSRLQVGRPVGPMLAQTATNVGDALAELGGEAVVRGQARRRAGADPPRRRRRSRSSPAASDDVTARLPEVVAAAPGAAGALAGRRRRGDRAAPGRPPAPVPGRPRRVSARRADIAAARQRCRCRRSSSTCCTSTARICSTRRTAERLAALDRIVPPGDAGRPAASPPTRRRAQAFLDANARRAVTRA